MEGNKCWVQKHLEGGCHSLLLDIIYIVLPVVLSAILTHIF